jgi:enoyl-CoA hydratase/carnithine racemase
MGTERQWKNLTLRRDGRRLIVRIDTGHRANAFSTALLNELIDLARELEDDSELSAVILHGQDRIFSGGMDLDPGRSDGAEESQLAVVRKRMQLGPRLCEAWERVEPITIAAIEGWCVGAGVALVAALDFRVVAASSVLYVAEVERGMNMSWGSVPRMVSLIGPSRTKRFFALAEKVEARRALEWGLADELCADGAALDRAIELADRATSVAPVPLRMCKQAVNVAANALSHAVTFMDTDQLILTQTSADFREGIAAFLGKRKPNYTGR